MKEAARGEGYGHSPGVAAKGEEAEMSGSSCSFWLRRLEADTTDAEPKAETTETGPEGETTERAGEAETTEIAEKVETTETPAGLKAKETVPDAVPQRQHRQSQHWWKRPQRQQCKQRPDNPTFIFDYATVST